MPRHWGIVQGLGLRFLVPTMWVRILLPQPRTLKPPSGGFFSSHLLSFALLLGVPLGQRPFGWTACHWGVAPLAGPSTWGFAACHWGNAPLAGRRAIGATPLWLGHLPGVLRRAVGASPLWLGHLPGVLRRAVGASPLWLDGVPLGRRPFGWPLWLGHLPGVLRRAIGALPLWLPLGQRPFGWLPLGQRPFGWMACRWGVAPLAAPFGSATACPSADYLPEVSHQLFKFLFLWVILKNSVERREERNAGSPPRSPV